MNANEIAEQLENISWLQGDGKVKPFQHYANFVRQQQAEIEALKDKLHFKEFYEVRPKWASFGSITKQDPDAIYAVGARITTQEILALKSSAWRMLLMMKK